MFAARGYDVTWMAVSHPLVVPPDDEELSSWWSGYEEGRMQDWDLHHQKSRQFRNETGYNFAQHAPSIIVPPAALEIACSMLRGTLLPLYHQLEG